jgi:AcrR family transcriptional regulator
MMTTDQAPGRRERKKAATRKALADAALRLFLEHGYDQVTVREVADAADVSATTLLKHFPSKEALAFDGDAEVEATLIKSVADRTAGTSILEALRVYMRSRLARIVDDQKSDGFIRLVQETPALREYAHKMWMRHQDALAHAVASELRAPSDDPHCAALARFALEAIDVAARSPDPSRTLDAAFDILEHGWQSH